MTSKLSTRYRAVLWWSSFTRFWILMVILSAALRMLRRFLDGACAAWDNRLSWCWHSLWIRPKSSSPILPQPSSENQAMKFLTPGSSATTLAWPGVWALRLLSLM